MYLDELIVQSRVGDRRQVKNRVELFVAELFSPIKRSQVLRNEIAAIAREISEIPGAKIIDHRQARLRKSFLQGERQVGADKAGATCDDEVGVGIR